MSEFGSITDFDVVYTGETITCGDDVIIDQGESLRSVLETLGNKACESDSNNDDIVEKVNDLEVSLQGTDDIAKSALSSANNANDKADDALNQIANLPDPIIEVNPNDVGLSKANMIPISSSGTQWQNGGIEVSQDPTSTSLVQRIDGRIKVSPASEEDDAVTKKQLDDAQFEAGIHEDNLGTNPVTNSPRSLIMKSKSSRIELLPGSANESNLIIAGRSSTIERGGKGFNIIMNSDWGLIDSGYYQSIIASSYSQITGEETTGISFGSSTNRAIIASSESNLTGRRRNSAIIASHRAVTEEYTVSGQVKWNSVIIASRESKLKSSNSYTLVTGQGTVSNASGQIVMGTYNLDEPSVSIYAAKRKVLVVGNGQAASYLPDGTPQGITRSNAFEVNFSGEAWVQSQMEVDKPGGGVVLKSPNGIRFLLTVDDTGNLTTTEIN